MQLLPSHISEFRRFLCDFCDLPEGERRQKSRSLNFVHSACARSSWSASFLADQRTIEKPTAGQAGPCPPRPYFPPHYSRDFLDEAEPALLQRCFESMEPLMSEPPMRQAFGRLGGRTLIALDGTEFSARRKSAAQHCLTRKRANGKTESYHSMLRRRS